MGKNDANRPAFPSQAVTDQDYPHRTAKSDQDETTLSVGMVGIADQPRTFVEKHRSSLIERDTVLLEVLGRLARIPFKAR